MKNALMILVTGTVILLCICQSTYSWSDVATHAAITDKAVHLSSMEDYLKNQLGIKTGLGTEFQTVFYPAIEERMKDLDPKRTNRTALDWIKTDSHIEGKALINRSRVNSGK